MASGSREGDGGVKCSCGTPRHTKQSGSTGRIPVTSTLSISLRIRQNSFQGPRIAQPQLGISRVAKKIWTLRHAQFVIAAKFSSDGDRLATATYEGSVRVSDNHGHLLVDIPVTVTPWHNNGLLWFNNHIFVIFDNTIKRLDASTGSTVSEWPVPNSNIHLCVVIPRHGKFIACSTSRSITFWDMSTHLQIGLVEHTENICSIALFPDNRSLVIGGETGTLVIGSLFHFIVST